MPLNGSKNVVELLQRLIQIASVNPDGDPGTDQVGELACAEFVAECLRELGAEVVLEMVETDRPNVIGRFYPSGETKERPRILFGPHLDTVSVGGMTIDPFGGEVRDGKVWGRGACDTKGTMAAMLWMLHEVREKLGARELGADVAFVAFMGEETGQPGSRHFAEHHGAEFDFAVIGEPTENHIVHCHKGCFWAKLETTGLSVHGSNPHLGENAITKMLSVLQLIDTEFREHLKTFTHPVLGHSTVNIGMIEGGTRANIVPDCCTAMVDMRETPSLIEAGGAGHVLREFLDERGFGEEFVSFPRQPKPIALDVPADNEYVQKLAGASPGTCLAGASWFCDAAWLTELGGVPAVAAGPGCIEQAHTEDEWISIEQLKQGVAFYRRFVEAL